MSAKTTKHIPLRRCAACGTRAPKRDLVRIVRAPDGAVDVDPKGKRAGRGAYLCRSQTCWDAGLKGGRLDAVLKQPLSQEDRARVRQALEALAGTPGNGP